MKRVFWTPLAKESLQETVDFIGKRWNENIVDDFLDRLDHRISQIQQNPELAPPFTDSKFRQLLIHQTVSLFYRDYPDHIRLVLVWDNRQNPEVLNKALTG